jgi:hypothetical protein
MSHTQFNLKKSNKYLTRLLLRLAWLNLKDKHMTTVTEGQGVSSTGRLPSLVRGSTRFDYRLAL